MAVEAVRAQLCNVVEDGTVSDADATALEGIVAAAGSFDVPAAVLDAAKAVSDKGSAAGAAEVAKLKAAACSGGTATG